MAELFGFKITRSKNEKATSQDFTLPSVDDGSQTVIGGGGHIGHYLDIEGKIKDEAHLIRKRETFDDLLKNQEIIDLKRLSKTSS